jgi:serine protease Do
MRSSIRLRSSAAALLLAAGLMSAASLAGTSAANADTNPSTSGATEQQQNAPDAKRGWLGVKIQSIDEDTAAALGLSDAKGALIIEVMPDGPAAKAGLKVNDAILAMNGQAIADGKDFVRLIASQTPDSTADLKIQRADSEQIVKVTLGAFAKEAANTEPSAAPAAAKSPKLGLRLAKGENGEGVLIADVDPSSDAASKGLASGDVILEINGQQVTSPEQVVESLKTVHGKGRKAVLLLVKSGDETRSVPVRFSVVG